MCYVYMSSVLIIINVMRICVQSNFCLKQPAIFSLEDCQWQSLYFQCFRRNKSSSFVMFVKEEYISDLTSNSESITIEIQYFHLSNTVETFGN